MKNFSYICLYLIAILILVPFLPFLIIKMLATGVETFMDWCVVDRAWSEKLVGTAEKFAKKAESLRSRRKRI